MTLLKAREATIKYSLSAVSIDTSGPIDADFSGGTTIVEAKDITISPPEGAVEQLALIGETSGFQNAEMDEKNFGNATCTGTLIIDGDEVLEGFMGGTSGTSVTGGYTRYQYGDSTATKTRVKVGALLVNIDNSGEEVSYVFNNVYFTKLGDVKLTGVDGHWEMEFEATCLPKDFYVEYKN